MTKIIVVDTETTGPDPAVAKVVEIGVVELDDDNLPLNYWSSYVNPGTPIPPEASAIHHIVDGDVFESPSLGDTEIQQCDYAVAHRASFEASMLPQITVPWVCTYKCAYTAWSAAPAYSLHALRYWRGLVEVDGVDRSAGSHRALPDALVCAALFRQLAEGLTIEEMASISARPLHLRSLPFGKYAGQPVAEIPTGYWRWILNQGTFDEDVVHTAEHEIRRR